MGAIKMALINCPDCGGEVSDRADACPNCARPIRGADTPAEGVQTIEDTGKRWKLMRVVSVLAILGGIAVVVIVSSATSAGEDPNTAAVVLGSFTVLGGMALYMWARIGKWWHHK